MSQARTQLPQSLTAPLIKQAAQRTATPPPAAAPTHTTTPIKRRRSTSSSMRPSTTWSTRHSQALQRGPSCACMLLTGPMVRIWRERACSPAGCWTRRSSSRHANSSRKLRCVCAFGPLLHAGHLSSPFSAVFTLIVARSKCPKTIPTTPLHFGLVMAACKQYCTAGGSLVESAPLQW
jgi:hypothetical protein